MSLISTIAEAAVDLRTGVGYLLSEAIDLELRARHVPKAEKGPGCSFAQQVFRDMQILDAYATLAAFANNARRFTQGRTDLCHDRSRL